jgi:hypothetical protein
MGASESTPVQSESQQSLQGIQDIPDVSASDVRVLQEMSPHDKVQLQSALKKQQKEANHQIQQILKTAKSKTKEVEKQQAVLLPSDLTEKERSDLMSVPPHIALEAQKKISATVQAHKQKAEKLVKKEAEKANRTHFLYGASHTDDNFNWVKGHTLLQYPDATVRRVGDVRAVISGLEEVDLKKLVRFFKRSIDNMDAEIKDGERIVVRIANTVNQDVQKAKKSTDRKKMLDDIKKVGKPAKSYWLKAFEDPYGLDQEPMKLRHVQAPKQVNVGIEQVKARVQRLKQVQKNAQVLEAVHDMFETAQKKYADDAQSTQDIHHLFQKYEGIVQRLEDTQKMQGVADLFVEAEAQVKAIKTAKTSNDKEKLKKAVHALQPLVAKTQKVVKKLAKSGVKKSPASKVLKAEAKVVSAVEKVGECTLWEKDKSHNPFNPTSKGKKLSPTGGVAKSVTAFCTNPIKFCSGKLGASEKRTKFCAR